MNKTEFKKIVGEILKSKDFAYENKYYTFENTDLKVFIGFQKSNFENSFYINYGFLIIGFDECYLGNGPLYRLDVTSEVVAKKGISVPSGE